ncbi:MAG: cytochrome c peroxidase [Deltaproteobacteria bacterium]|nr:cytochrome c peroxidase [Deltaproteobacteria bacterium]
MVGALPWHAAHTAALCAPAPAGRVTVLDLLVLGPDNLPATPRDLAAWRPAYDAPADALAIDPGYLFQSLYFGVGQLPIIFLVDPRTMRPLRVLTMPTSDELEFAVAVAMAQLDGLPRPTRPEATLYDGRFSPDQWDIIRAMTPMPPPPPDPTNTFADDPRAAELGRALFSDTALSPSGRVACATCHRPERAFADGLAQGVGVAAGDRNTPSVLFAAWSCWQFWDGRADAPWSQALGPCENPVEIDSSRLLIAHAVADRYAAACAAVFGALPPLGETARFPPSGRPDQGAWEAMAAPDRDAVNRVFANVGKAQEAFERTLRTRPSALDAYAAGDREALTPRARDGLARFFEAGCIQCHYGPRLTDDSFHNIAMPTGRRDGQPDVGRLGAIPALQATLSRADSPFSDATTSRDDLVGLTAVEAMHEQFRTPSLRGVAATGPWGHGGTFATLEAVMLHYARRRDGVPVVGTTGAEDLHLGRFHQDGAYLSSLADLMRAATADPLLP